jgi:hypothetical protein
MTTIALTADDRALFSSLEWYVGRGERASQPCERSLYGRALGERALPIVAAWLADDDPERPRFERAVEVISIINRIHKRSIYPTIDRISERGIDYRMLKGYDVATTANPRGLVHSANDVDFLFRRDDLEKVHEILTGLGFRQGHVNIYEDALYELDHYSGFSEDHYEVAPYILAEYVDELAPYRDVVKDVRAAIPQILFRDRGTLFATRFDVHYNLDSDFPVDELWKSNITAPSGGRMLKFLEREIAFPFLCFKCYVEAGRVKGRMRQFFDCAIVAMETKNMDWDRVLHIAKTRRFSESIYYVSYHINGLLGSVVPERVLEATRPRGRRELHVWRLSQHAHYGDFMPALLGQATPIPLGWE